MTLQEIYDKVRNHMLKQGRRSVISDNSRSCAYRGSGGMMCAVGCLIPDEKYSPDIEGMSAEKLKEGLFPFPLTQRVRCLLSELQLIHDFREVHKWEHHLYRAALHHGLHP